jgi:hypothetical protein
MKIAVGVWVALLLVTASPAIAGIRRGGGEQHAQTVLARASPSPSPAAGSPAASPSAGEEGDRGWISTGAGLVIAAVLVGGLLLMRNRLLRR